MKKNNAAVIFSVMLTFVGATTATEAQQLQTKELKIET